MRHLSGMAGLSVVASLALVFVPSVWASSPLVLQANDAPGLSLVRGTVADGRRALAAALRPARLSVLSGEAQASHFRGRDGAELWSLALVVQNPRAAENVLRSIATAARRARLTRVRADIGDSGWILRRRIGGPRPIVAVWRSNRGLGAIVLRVPRPSRSLAKAFARLADLHLRRPLTQTAWERVLDGIRPNGKVPRKVALDLFALAYGPLPGAKRPSGSARGAHATLAGDLVIGLWSTLTPAQKEAAQRWLGITGVQVARSRARIPMTRWWHSSTDPLTPSDYGDPNFKPDPILQALADAYVPKYEALLRNYKLSVKLVVGSSSSDFVGVADSFLITPDGELSLNGTICRIRVHSPMLTGREEFQFVLAHEVFHCFQRNIGQTSRSSAFLLLPWVSEGTAEWAALSVYPLPWEFGLQRGLGTAWFKTYLGTCTTKPLFARARDALGFFGHAYDATGNLWGSMVQVIAAGDNDGSYSAAGGNQDPVLASWASSVFIDGNYGYAWDASSPVKPPADARCPARPLTGPAVVKAEPYTLTPYTLEPASFDPKLPLLHLNINGSARLGDRSLDRTDLDDAWFCLRQECKCPPGQEGEPPPAPPLGPVVFLGLTGGPTGSTGRIATLSLDEYCKRKQKKPPAPRRGPPIGGGGASSGCSTGCGSSFADPHLITFDGQFYDFQGAGEFTLARSRLDAFEVQVRQEPVPGSTRFAVNTGVAMRVGSERVGVYRGSPLVVRVNGLGFLPSKRYRRLPSGGQVRLLAQDDVEVTWPDRTTVRVHAESDSWVSVLVKPALSRRRTLTGLLGNFDGNLKNDFVTRRGRRLSGDVARSYRLLYRTLGESWRVAQGRSLFDYARGQSTRTFTKRRFPGRIVTAADLPQRVRERAERACRRIGIRNQNVFRSCVLDVGGTGDNRFATSGRRVERIARRFGRPSARGGSGEKGGACKPKTTTVGGQPAVVFCGPAVATIKAVGRTFRIKGGSCVIQSGVLFAQVGTSGGPNRGGLQTRPLFYVLFDPANASKEGLLYWIVDGKRYRAAKGAQIKLVGKRVTFSGELDRGVGTTGSGPFSGTLDCGEVFR